MYVEVGFAESEFINSAYIQSLSEILSSSEIRLLAMHAFLPNKIPSIKVLEEYIEIAIGLGTDSLVIELSPDSLSLGNLLKKTLVTLEEILSEKGIIVSVLAINDSLLYWLLNLLKEESFEFVRIALDVARVGLGEEELIVLLAEEAGWINIIHASNKFPPNYQWGLPIFDPQGILDYGLLIRVIKEIDYMGSFILDYAPRYKRKYLEDIAKVKEYLLSPII